MKETLRNRKCTIVLILASIISFTSGVLLSNSVFMLGKGELVIGCSLLLMLAMLSLLVWFLIRGH